MGNVRCELLLPFKGFFQFFQHLIKGLRKLVDLILSIAQTYSLGKIFVLPDLLYSFCDPGNRQKGSSGKTITYDPCQHYQKRKKDRCKAESDSHTVFRPCNRKDPPKIYHAVTIYLLADIIDIPFLLISPDSLDLSFPKRRCPVITVRQPAIEKFSIFTVQRQVDTVLQIIKIAVYFQPAVIFLYFLQAFLHLTPQIRLYGRKQFLIAERKQDSQGQAGNQSHKKCI